MDDQDKSLAIGVQVHTDAGTKVKVTGSDIDSEAYLTFRAGYTYSSAVIHINRETARKIVDALNEWLA